MTQQEKQLLLIDLCARLPYGVTVYDYDREEIREMGLGTLHDIMFNDLECKPYLRSMSSMTEEECKYCAEHFGIQSVMLIGAQHGMIMPMEASPMFIVWLNEHHFDYRGLIEKGLALQALEGMYN